MQRVRQLYRRKRFFGIEMMFLIFLPLLILTYVKLPVYSRYIILFLGVIYILIAGYINRFSRKKMGLSSYQFAKSFKTTMLITGLQLLVLIIFAYWQPHLISGSDMGPRPFMVPFWAIVAGYVFLSVPIQELVFRGFLIPRIELVTQNSAVAIVLSAIIFASAHLFFRSTTLVVATFIGGIFWGYLFVKYRNLWPIQVSHAILGVVFLYLIAKHNPFNQAEWHYWLNLLMEKVSAWGMG